MTMTDNNRTLVSLVSLASALIAVEIGKRVMSAINQEFIEKYDLTEEEVESLMMSHYGL